VALATAGIVSFWLLIATPTAEAISASSWFIR
jgi:hypothetical protein